MDRIKSRGTSFREKEKENHITEGISSLTESSAVRQEDRQAEHQALLW